MPTAPTATLVGLTGAVVSAAGSWVPSYWSDEAASLRAARLPWNELVEFVQSKDVVHLAYYALLHVWIVLCGESEFAVRLPSAIAIGAACAGLVVLVRRFAALPVAAAAGLVLAVLPRMTFAGSEARPYAIGVALVVWATVALLAANRWWRWVLYALALAAAVHVFLYSALLLPVHALYLVQRRADRATLLGWVLAALGSLAACIPIGVVAFGQRDQIAWLASQPVNPWTVLVEPVFERGWLAAVLVGCGLLAWALARRARRRGAVRVRRNGAVRVRPSDATSLPPRDDATPLFVLWLVVPTVLLVLAHLLAPPAYLPRYLAIIAPALAALVALAAASLPRAARVAALAALLVAVAPAYASQRSPHGKPGGTDLAAIAEYVSAHARPGDAVLLDAEGTVSLRSRQAIAAYPAAFEGLDDIALEAPYWVTGTYSDRLVDLPELERRLAGESRVWVVGRDVEPGALAASRLRPAGSAVAGSTPIVLYTR
jgi:mannosyltransferase